VRQTAEQLQGALWPERKGRSIYWPCRNTALGADQFSIDPGDYACAEDTGEIVAVVHSHPDATPDPSEADLVGCEASGLEWHIVGLPALVWRSIRPSGYRAPLVGRQFVHGVLDCYAIIRDWYRQERGVELLDFERHDDWWLRGQDLYRQNFRAAGFEPCEELHPGAVLLMQIQSPVPNHAAIYLGDDFILHHLHGRLSSRDVFGGMWRKHTVTTLRYVGAGHA